MRKSSPIGYSNAYLWPLPHVNAPLIYDRNLMIVGSAMELGAHQNDWSLQIREWGLTICAVS